MPFADAARVFPHLSINIELSAILPMRFFPKLVPLLLVIGGLTVNTAYADIVFDQGPLTGSFGGAALYVNQTADQNFADLVTFAADTNVDGINYFTRVDLGTHTGSDDFHLKILADNSGIPGAVLFADDLGFSSYYVEGGCNAYHFDFTSQLFAAGTSYWVGISGNGFDAGQLGLLDIAGGDATMAVFEGSTFVLFSGLNVGDQAFQLIGNRSSSVPDASYTGLLLGTGLVTLAVFRRRFAN